MLFTRVASERRSLLLPRVHSGAQADSNLLFCSVFWIAGTGNARVDHAVSRSGRLRLTSLSATSEDLS